MPSLPPATTARCRKRRTPQTSSVCFVWDSTTSRKLGPAETSAVGHTGSSGTCRLLWHDPAPGGEAGNAKLNSALKDNVSGQQTNYVPH